MPEADNWRTILQWVGGFGVLVGGIVAGALTRVSSRRSGGDTERDRDDRERVERTKRYSAERELELERLESRLEGKFQAIIKALREALEFAIKESRDELKDEFKGFADRMLAAERDILVMKSRRTRE